MFYLGQIILLTAAIVAVILGVAVFVQGGLNRKSIYFALMVLSAVVWATWLAVFLQEENVNQLVSRAQVFYTSTMVLPWAMLMMSMSFLTMKESTHIKVATLSGLPGLLMIIIIYIRPDFLFAEPLRIDGVNSIVLHIVGYGIYSLIFAAYSLAAVAILIIVLRKMSKDLVLARKRIEHMVMAYIVSLPFGAFFNLILPWFGNYDLVWVGPLAILTFVVVSYIAIVKYGLFDMRATASKVLSYFVTIICLSLIYVVVFYLIFRFLFKVEEPSVEIFILNLAMSIVIMMLFPLIAHLNHFVRLLFYVNTSDIDISYTFKKLNDMVVRCVPMLKFIMYLGKMLHLEYVGLIAPMGKTDLYIYGTRKRDIDAAAARNLYEAVGHMPGVKWVGRNSVSDIEARRLLEDLNIAVVVRLYSERGDLIGLLLLGNTKGRSEILSSDVDAVRELLGLVEVAVENRMGGGGGGESLAIICWLQFYGTQKYSVYLGGGVRRRYRSWGEDARADFMLAL
jgi:hypothetical protein